MHLLSKSLGGRAAWTFVDQALSSLSNAALSIVVARSVSPPAFGAFAIALLVFSFVIGTSRAMITDPLVIRFSAARASAQQAAARAAVSCAIAVGALTAVGCITAGLASGLTSELGAVLVALGCVLPGLLLQDAFRYIYFCQGQPRGAARLDFVWTLAQAVIIGVLLVSERDTVVTLVLAWGGSAALAGLVGAYWHRQWPSPRGGWAWLRENRHLSWRFGADFIVNQGAATSASALVGPVSSISAVGELSAGRTLLGPLGLLFSGTSSLVLPLYARVAHTPRLLRQAGLTTIALVTGSILWVAFVALLPTEWGVWLLRDNWAGAAAVLLPLGWSMIMIAGSVGAALALKARSEARALLRVTLIQAPLLLVCGVFGGWLAGAKGAAVGFAAVQTLGCALTWAALLRSERRLRLSPATV